MGEEFIISDLIVKDLRGESSREEEDMLGNWQRRSVLNADFFNHVTRAETIFADLRIIANMDIPAIDRKLAEKLGFSIDLTTRRAWFYQWTSYAAALIVLIVGWGVVYQWKKGHSFEDIGSKAVSYELVSAPDHGTRKLSLPDGSKVMLNFASSLQYPSIFRDGERRVKVVGEAFFEVAKDSKHPFVVETDRQVVEVTGTSFDVSDYRREPMQRTVVHSGSVVVQHSGRRIQLRTGQALQAIGDSIQTRVLPKEIFDRSLSWQRGYFNFDGMDIRSAMYRLAQFYHKDVEFSSDLKRGALGSGDFQQDLPLRELLDHLELPDLHFDIKGDIIVVKR